VALYVPDDLGELIWARQRGANLLGQGPMGGVGAHRQRDLEPSWRVLDHDVVTFSGQQDADGRAVTMLRPPAQQVIDGVDVEVQLPRCPGSTRPAFSSNTNVCLLPSGMDYESELGERVECCAHRRWVARGHGKHFRIAIVGESGGVPTKVSHIVLQLECRGVGADHYYIHGPREPRGPSADAGRCSGDRVGQKVATVSIYERPGFTYRGVPLVAGRAPTCQGLPTTTRRTVR